MVTIVRTEEAAVASLAPATVRPHVVNRIVGTILTAERMPYGVLHVKTDEGAALAMRIDGRIAPPELRPFLSAGQRIVIAIDAAEVRLHPGPAYHAEGSNEWPARVVLVEPDRSAVTVKIRGQQITLKSLDADMRQVWDSTNVRIAPAAVRIVLLGSCARLRRRMLTECLITE
jgi:hypothetical protein